MGYAEGGTVRKDIKKEGARKESKQRWNEVVLAVAAARKSVAGPHHQLNILSLPDISLSLYLSFFSSLSFAPCLSLLLCPSSSSHLRHAALSFSLAGEAGVLSLTLYLRTGRFLSYFLFFSSFYKLAPSHSLPSLFVFFFFLVGATNENGPRGLR